MLAIIAPILGIAFAAIFITAVIVEGAMTGERAYKSYLITCEKTDTSPIPPHEFFKETDEKSN